MIAQVAEESPTTREILEMNRPGYYQLNGLRILLAFSMSC